MILKKINVPGNYKIFFIILSIIAIIAGSLFYFKLGNNSQEVIKNYMESYFMFDEYNSYIRIFLFNFLIFLLIWLLGLSMFGSIIISFIYFFKLFLLSVSVSSIISLEESNGVFKAFLYVFPNQILMIFIYALLSIYAINLSFMFFKIIFSKKNLEFKAIFKTYNKIFVILFLVLNIVILYQVYINPLVFKLFIK